MSALRLEGTGRGAIAGTPTAFRGQSVCPFCPPQPVSPPLLSQPVLQPPRRLHPSFHSRQSHSSVPLHNPTPRSGHPLPLPLWSCLSHQEKATLTGQLAQLPCLPITAAWEAGLGISRVLLHILQQLSCISLLTCCKLSSHKACTRLSESASLKSGRSTSLPCVSFCCPQKSQTDHLKPPSLPWQG